jgi:nicotinate-nucleotide adenylyltransferase
MDIQKTVNHAFLQAFGRTPLAQRLNDILGEAIELSRFTDMQHLREELGDLLSSSMQLANECNWTVEELIRENLDKIERRQIQYRSLGRKTAVALLGGAMDPITLGHIEIAKFVLNTSKTFDEVYLMPCYEHMTGKQMAPPEHRLEMCRLAAQCDARIKVFDYEIANKLSGETYQTIKLLQEEDFAKHKFDFSLIIGMDNANNFEKWVNYQLLERLIRFVVVPRQGVEMDPRVSWYLKSPHIFLGNCENQIRQVSSTEVRTALQEPFPRVATKDMLDLSVFSHIMRNNLYGGTYGNNLEGETRSS